MLVSAEAKSKGEFLEKLLITLSWLIALVLSRCFPFRRLGVFGIYLALPHFSPAFPCSRGEVPCPAEHCQRAAQCQPRRLAQPGLRGALHLRRGLLPAGQRLRPLHRQGHLEPAPAPLPRCAPGAASGSFLLLLGSRFNHRKQIPRGRQPAEVPGAGGAPCASVGFHFCSTEYKRSGTAE